jgi:hypothetical protein
MALPEDAPEDMGAAFQAEFSLVEGLVREAARAKGDAVGRCKLNAVDPQLESAWFQPLTYEVKKPVSEFCLSNAPCAATTRAWSPRATSSCSTWWGAARWNQVDP